MRAQLEREITDIAPGGAVDVTAPAALIFQHAFQNQRVYRALCGHQGGALVQRHLRRMVGNLLRQRLRPQFARTGTEVSAEVADWSREHKAMKAVDLCKFEHACAIALGLSKEREGI